MLISNCAFDENSCSTGTRPSEVEPSGTAEDAEFDEELRGVLADRGLSVASAHSMSRPAATLTELSVSPAALSGHEPRVHVTQLVYPAVAAWRESSEGLLAVLRTPEGHGAFVRSTLSQDSSRSTVNHVDTFPGLGLCCEMPGFAYLVVSPKLEFAALGRWRGVPAVEIFQHPRGASSGKSTGLSLPQGSNLLGLAFVEDSLFVLHSARLDKYPIPADLNSSCLDREEADIWDAPPPGSGDVEGMSDWHCPDANRNV